MIATWTDEQGRDFQADLEKGTSLAHRYAFNQEAIRAFGAEAPREEVYRFDDFVGDPRQGGSCHCREVYLLPHCHGTHTECIGHALDDGPRIHEVLSGQFFSARVLSVPWVPRSETHDSVPDQAEPGDRVITQATLEGALEALGGVESLTCEALILASLGDRPRVFDARISPYLSYDAMRSLASSKIHHLLVEGASVDRLDDGGKLGNHRIFWGLPETGHEAGAGARMHRTITELCLLPEDLSAGPYLLDLKVLKLDLDAAPSLPTLFPILESESL